MLEWGKNVAYKGAGLVLNTGLGQAAVRWALKPRIMEEITKGKAEFKASLVKAKDELAKDKSDAHLKKIPTLRKLADEVIAQLDEIAEDLTIDANINLAINILCSHFGDFDDVNKIGDEIEKLLKDDIEALGKKFLDELTDPDTGVFDLKLFEEIQADFDKLDKIAHLSQAEREATTKLVKNGLLMKKIQKMRDGLSDENIETVIDKAKELLSKLFDKLKFTAKEQSDIDEIIDHILMDHLDEAKAKLDRLLKITPKILNITLEEGLKKKQSQASLDKVDPQLVSKKKPPLKKRRTQDEDESEDKDLALALELSAKAQPKGGKGLERKSLAKGIQIKSEPKAESDDEDLAQALELSAKEHKTAIVHAKKKHAPVAIRAKAKPVVAVDLLVEEKTIAKKKGPGKKNH